MPKNNNPDNGNLKITPEDFKELLFAYQQGSNGSETTLVIKYPIKDEGAVEEERFLRKSFVVDSLIRSTGLKDDEYAITAKVDEETGLLALSYEFSEAVEIEKYDIPGIINSIQNISQEKIDSLINEYEDIILEGYSAPRIEMGENSLSLSIENASLSRNDLKIYQKISDKLDKVSESGGFQADDTSLENAIMLIEMLAEEGDLIKSLKKEDRAEKRKGNSSDLAIEVEKGIDDLLNQLEKKAEDNLRRKSNNDIKIN
jgi:hypothetical protein